MSFLTINKCVNDSPLRERILACIVKICRDPDPSGTYGIPADSTLINHVRQNANNAEAALNDIMWRIAIQYETQYASVYHPTNNPTPGLDQGLITDTIITTAVVNNWPPNS